ncbi:MAG: hypothetical protein EZS28_016532 [Streblomastix strix]|uniref:Uncharacterized protein n=1 Tax=Streblomastix strix TaxID=222440 RepID=A0A5J4VZ31_9EUKA|nr:MAG: hypothetical protein EZS28_016532 [Streblomastix strix]
MSGETTVLAKIQKNSGKIRPAAKKEGVGQIAQMLAYLFKSLPLPPEIRIKVIHQFKTTNPPDFNELPLLAEYQENHDVTLANQFEMEFFKKIFYF